MDQAERLRNIIKVQNQIPENAEANSGTTKTEVKRARILTVTSGKGGVGKSSIVINLAMQFRKQNKKVIIFDADFGLANIEVMFGAIPKYSLADMIFRGKDLKEIIVAGPMDIGFISGGSGIRGLNNIGRDQAAFLVYKLRELELLADIIIIDTGAGISDSVIEFVATSGEVLLVTTPEPTSITDSYALLKTLNNKPEFDKQKTTIKIIANRVTNYEEGKNLFNKLSVVVEKFLKLNMEFVGVVPMDTNLPKSVMQQKPISLAYPNSQATKAITNIALKLLDQEVEMTEKKGLVQVFARLFRNGNKV